MARERKKTLGYMETYLKAIGWGVVFVGGVFAYRAIGDIYDRLAKGQPIDGGSQEEKKDGYLR